MDTNILLESGTNELEVLEFTLGDNHYGINVAKIREIFAIYAGSLLFRILIRVLREYLCHVTQ